MAKSKAKRLPNGRFATKEQAKYWGTQGALSRREALRIVKAFRKEQVKKAYKKRGQRTKGHKLSVKPSKRFYNEQEARNLLVASNYLPKPDLQEKSKAGTTDIYQWLGTENLATVENLLVNKLELERPNPLTRVSIGTGYGRMGDWMGSPWDRPRGTWRWLQGWNFKPSAQPILQFEKFGGKAWIELEVHRKQGRIEYGLPRVPRPRKRSVRRVRAGNPKARKSVHSVSKGIKRKVGSNKQTKPRKTNRKRPSK